MSPPRSVLLGLLLTWACSPLGRAAAPSDARLDRIRSIFQPFQTERAALAPDGGHLAYELRRADRLFLVIVNLATNRAVELPLVEDRAIPLSGVPEKVPARLTGLVWPTSDRLVGVVQDELLFGVDADGRNFRPLVDARRLEWIAKPARESGKALRPPTRLLPGYDASEPGFADPNATRGLERARSEPASGPEPVSPWTRPSTISIHTDLGDPTSAELFNSVSAAGTVPTYRARLGRLLPDRPEEILLEVRGRGEPWDDAPTVEGEPAVNAFNLVTALARVNIRTGRVMWSEADFATSRMLADAAGNLRLKLKHFSTERTLHVAPRPNGRFRDLDTFTPPNGVPPFTIRAENFFSPRAIPLGFGYEPDLLYYAANSGRDTFGIYALDLSTRQRTDFAVEHATVDLADLNAAINEDALVFDRHRRQLAGIRFESLRRETIWLDPELQALQTQLAQLSPDVDFEILEWDAERTRFLVLGSNPSDPGAYFLYDRAASRLGEYVRRAPWITLDLSSTTSPMIVSTDSGARLPCYFTYPVDRRIEPVPLLIYCHDGPWSRDRAGYDRGAQALASMGFAVLQVNYRGSSGFGRTHLDALRELGERVAMEDLLTALDAVQASHAVSKRRVAILGHGYGGTLALRAAQLHPDRFRCAVSINAPTQLSLWLEHPPRAISFTRDVRRAFFGPDPAKLRTASPASDPSAFTRPLLIVHSEGDTVVPQSQARLLRRALRGRSQPEVEYLELPYEGHARWLPGSYVTVFSRLEDFFKTHIFAFQVEAGEAEVVH